MRIMSKNRIFIFLALLVFVASSCYDPISGCLDSEAVNYDIDGDTDCEDCCIFPTIKMSIFHQNGDTTFFLEDTLVNNLGQEYSIIKFAYLISDFSMITSDGQEYKILDSIELDVADGTEWVKDDVVRVRRDGFSYVYGTTIFDGQGEQLSFQVGLDDKINQNRFTTEVSDHPLTNDVDSLFREDSGDYTFQRIQVAQGIEFKDTVIYDVFGSDNVQQVNFDVAYESVRGSDKTVIIEARYNHWFEDVDFETMSKTEIESMIATKSATMFRRRIN